MAEMDFFLNRIESVLDQLIANEMHINELSLGEPGSEEISNLQDQQEHLLIELQQADLAFSEAAKQNHEALPLQGKVRINEKLIQFQKLNNEFIERLKSRRHFIHFEVKRHH